MRMNLVIHGIAESPKENTLEVTSNTLVKRLKIPTERIRRPGANSGDISLDIAHRMGRYSPDATRPRPIVLKLVDRHSKYEILKFTKNLKGSHITVTEQFPDVVRAKRAALVPELKKQRGLGHLAHIRGDKLIVDGRPAKTQEVSSPVSITPTSIPAPPLLETLHTQEVRTNKFVAVAVKVSSHQDIATAVKQLFLVPDASSASHIMYSYRLGEVTGYDVDGEFGAHGPLVKALQAHDDVLVAVLRWSGNHLGPQRFDIINDIATKVITKLFSE